MGRGDKKSEPRTPKQARKKLLFDAMLFSVAKWQIKSSHPNRSSLLRMLASGCGRGVSRKSMKITYDKEADALYIRLLEGRTSVQGCGGITAPGKEKRLLETVF